MTAKVKWLQLETQSGFATIRKRDISAIVFRNDDNGDDYLLYDIHMKSGTIFTTKDFVGGEKDDWTSPDIYLTKELGVKV